MSAQRRALLSRYGFELDRFQLEAIDAIDQGRHVIVAAPTGSGKTVVAEYGVARAIGDGRRAFYTSPIKALSNQKFRDLVEIHGADSVGLLTGDTAINGDAPIVVMTTEVLRNMIYAGRNLASLATVVLDEVHFLQDTYRGPVWEEVIIHLPDHVKLVCLSATVSNADELAEWIETVRGPTTAVVEVRRPVQLDNWYFVHDLTHQRLRLLPTLIDGVPNPDAIRLDASAARHRRDRRDGRDGQRGQGSGERRLSTPGRLDTVEMLAERELLPAIFFIFSRAQCDHAARECVLAGMRFTDDQDRSRIREIAESRLDGLVQADLDVLGYEQFLAQIEIGVAAHHAGMVPPFKEVVERCFVEGLIRVVFATETLAVGINMPARAVVIEKLTRFTGDHHEVLTPGQFTQLTGRAGRRGIDELGTAVVLWSPFVRFDQVAELATSRSFQLRSAFRPTYNMAANLVRTYEPMRARQLLALSFAQFQADRDVVRIERRLQRQRDRLGALDATAASPYGDVEDFRRLVERGRGAHVRDDRVDLAMRQLRPGDVIHVTKGKHHGPVAVVATAHRKGGMRLTTITPGGHLLHLAAEDLTGPPSPIGTVVLPGTYSPNRKDYRSEVGRRVRSVKLRPVDRSSKRSGSEAAIRDGMHPVEADPDLKIRLKAAADADRVRREVGQLERTVKKHGSTLAGEFESVLGLLEERGLLDMGAWRLTESGEMLARLFHESDLLIAEALRNGVFDDVDGPTLAGLLSTFVYEHRSPDEPPAPWFPNDDVRKRWETIARLSRQLDADEVERGLTRHRPPEPTFFSIAYAWVAGEQFSTVVGDDDLTGGDFVRTMKQLIDLLGQLATVAPLEATRRTARRAADEAARGVVADASAAPAP